MSVGSGVGVIFTISEKSYKFGVVALLNSIVSAGYRGDFVIFGPAEQRDLKEAIEAAGLADRGIKVHHRPIFWQGHLTYAKPHCFQQIFNEFKSQESVLYVDPDIVFGVKWSLFDEWGQLCVCAFCDPTRYPLPETHPRLGMWRRFAEDWSMEFRSIREYVNAGFLLVPKQHRELIEAWQVITERLRHGGHIDFHKLTEGNPAKLFNAGDQDPLNFALRVTDVPVSLATPEDMGVGVGRAYVWHAFGPRKPWRGSFVLDALRRGVRPSSAARMYWANASEPVRLHSWARRLLAEIDIRFAIIVARLLG